MTEVQKNNVKIDVDLSKIEGVVGTDLKDYNMVESEIEIVEIRDYSTATDQKLRMLIQTKLVDEKKNKIRGTLFINLWKDRESGEIVYSKSENSYATKLLNFFKVENFEQLKGQKCKTIVKVDNNNKNRLEIYFGV